MVRRIFGNPVLYAVKVVANFLATVRTHKTEMWGAVYMFFFQIPCGMFLLGICKDDV